MARPKSFYELLTEATEFFASRGYTSANDLERWVKLLKDSAGRTLRRQAITEQQLRRSLTTTYRRMVVGGSILRNHTGVGKFTIQKLTPLMRKDLQQRIFASANLIKLNREEALSSTLRRFQGWATSVPKGGSKVVDRQDEKAAIRKPLSHISFAERRVVVDQTHKFAASLSATIATHNDAIAMKWHSNWRRPGYNYREDHKDRDLKGYAIRGNWALKQGLMKSGDPGYTDEITAPAEEIFCSCTGTYIYSLDSLPDDMLTEKGREFLASVRH